MSHTYSTGSYVPHQLQPLVGTKTKATCTLSYQYTKLHARDHYSIITNQTKDKLRYRKIIKGHHQRQS